jgi:hypothetical protein
MPENNEAVGGGSEEGLSPLETRLSPEAIANLDEMNKRVFGEQIGEDPAAPPAAAPATQASPPAPPAPAPAVDKGQTPPPPPQTTPPARDEFTPPDDDAPAAPPVDPTKPPELGQDELPEGKVLFPDEAIDKLRTEKAKGDIRELRARYDTARQSLAKQTEALTAAQKQVASQETNALVEDLKKRNAELNSIVEQKAIEDLPYFKNTYVEPRKALIKNAVNALELSDIEKPLEVLEKAMGLEGRARIAAFDQIFENVNSPTLRTRLENTIAQIESLDDQRNAFLADREGNTARIAAQTEAQKVEQAKQQEAWVKDGIKKTFDYLATKSPFFKRSGKPGYEAWDKAYDEDMALVEELSLRNENPLKLISTIGLGVRASRILAAYEKLKVTVAERDKTIAQLRGSRPTLTGDTVSGERQEGVIDPNENLVSAARRAIQEVSQGY